MRLTRSWISLLTIMVVVLGGCAESKAAVKKVSPARVEPIEGTNRKRIVLVPKAAERLALRTVRVREATPDEMAGVVPADQSSRTAIHLDAVLYDKTGAAFTYVNPKGFDYHREPITIAGIKNKVAVLAAGPPTGTAVVTAGAAELYGVDTGVGK